MVPAIVDISGLNRISRGVFARAAGAVCGMVDGRAFREGEDAPLIAASMFGNTTKCVEAARAIVEAAGFEVLVFHAVGTGGQTMESLIEAGHVAGVLDVTTTEWADELVGGVMSAGPTRLEAAAAHRHARGDRAGLPRHGELLGTAHPAGEVSRPPDLPAQPQTDADAHRSRRRTPSSAASSPAS